MKFKVGDLCLTQASRMPLLNDGSLVVVVGVDRGVKAHNGDSAPYLIRRVDGQRFGYTASFCGKDRFFASVEVWCRERMLRRFDESSSIPAKASRRRAKKAVAA